MRSYTNLELGVRSYELGGHETQQQHTNLFESTLEHEGVIGKDLGYRVYNFYSDGHGWRDNEYRREWTVSPSVLWKPLARFQVLVEYEHSRADSSPAAQTAIINPQYLADYANPPADVLAFHGRTADAYRARIFGSSQNWWVDTLSARGNTAAAALKGDIFRITNVGEGSFPGKPYDRASFSWQGKGGSKTLQM